MLQLFPGGVVAPVELAEAKGMVCIRAASASDVEDLSVYFTGLSTSSRNKRFMGARADLAVVAAECVAKADRPGHFTLLAEFRQEGQRNIIGETHYAYDAAARHGEFAISVADAFQRLGLGLQMMTAMETRAIDLGPRDDRRRDRADERGNARPGEEGRVQGYRARRLAVGSPRKAPVAIALHRSNCRVARIVL
ncbi:GNAT family N-acetyltransferase [Bradyrhizobium diazoefficiens]|uniref:GNAT family N-acetyltransferase n=1 Tax=Bradyrhizobium diazoefficiens TaxID=1355477 RepID=UPI002B45ACBF|nr:GNAT family N-acetyltransferase [Bradyrhizobium diazoefficiens]WRJ64909.1 GNAT family N-acetyltransferase [Bradyrhizobium diazoefficiens]